jgi:hypothetical protein
MRNITNSESWGPANTFRATFSLTEWATEPAVRSAWEQIVKENSLDNSHDPFADPTEIFPFLDGALWAGYRSNLSPTKGRKLGWHGFVDTYESIFVTLRELAQIGLLPPLKVGESGVPF